MCTRRGIAWNLQIMQMYAASLPVFYLAIWLAECMYSSLLSNGFEKKSWPKPMFHERKWQLQKKPRVLAIFPIEIFLCQHISTNRDRVFGKNATLTSLNITIHHLYPQELPGNAFHSWINFPSLQKKMHFIGIELRRFGISVMWSKSTFNM